MKVNYHGVFLTSLTTVIGYLSMNFSDSPPFHHLGNITAVGVAFAYLNSIAFLPALVMLLPVRVHARADRPHRALARLAEIVIRNRRAVLAGTVSVTLASLFFISRNRLDDGFINYFDPGTPFRADTDFAIENLTGIYSIEYAIGSGEEGGISEPGYLAKLDEFASWYREQPHVMHVDTFTDVLKRLNRNLHDDDPAFYRLPDDRELAAQALLLYEMALPSGLDLNDRIDVEKSSARFTVTLDNLSSRELQELDARAQDWLRHHAPETMFARGASTSVMFVDMTLRNIKGMFVGSTLELILISGCLIFALRSFRYGLLSLVPNLVPIVIAFGVWGLVDGRVNLGVSVVAGMTFGIVVDDTVHFLIKYLRARRKHGLGTEDAIRYVFTSVGPALVSTTAVLVAGFGTLILSGFVVNSDMGKLTAMTLAIAIAGDLLLLPCLLMAVDARSVRERSRGPAMIEADEVG
jgi:predicted RND superfamily exporter protein